MKVSLYLDEDAQDNDLIHALRLNGVDVVKAWDMGMRQRQDEEHLLFATAQGRVLFGFNAGDYFRLHTEFHTQEKSYAGIVLANPHYRFHSQNDKQKASCQRKVACLFISAPDGAAAIA